jgi:hypothetical protein
MLLALDLQNIVDGQSRVQQLLSLQTSAEHYQAPLYESKLEHQSSAASALCWRQGAML